MPERHFVPARPTLPDGVADSFARALHRGEAALARCLARARESTAANTVAAAPRADPPHPGGARYLGGAAQMSLVPATIGI